jgi:hypothetical protein
MRTRDDIDQERSSAIKTIIRRLIEEWPEEYTEVLEEMEKYPEPSTFAELGAQVFNSINRA